MKRVEIAAPHCHSDRLQGRLSNKGIDFLVFTLVSHSGRHTEGYKRHVCVEEESKALLNIRKAMVLCIQGTVTPDVYRERQLLMYRRNGNPVCIQGMVTPDV